MEMKSVGAHWLIEQPGEKLTDLERDKLLGMAGDFEEDVAALLTEAEQIACPKALFSAELVEEKGDDYVVIAGIKMQSAFLREKIGDAGRVFPYICSCGSELEQWSHKYDNDVMMSYFADEIKKAYLIHPRMAFFNYLKEDLGLGDHYKRLNPGSLPAWPISAQVDLFAVFGAEKVKELVGVTLTPSMLMLPSKSVSGITIPSDVQFENCELCPIINCPNRKAPSKVR